MRSLESTGIGLLPFMNARDVLRVPLELVNARHRAGTRPNGDPVTQVAFTLSIINPEGPDRSGWVTPDGDPIPCNFVVTLEDNEGRSQYVRYFERESESIGPVAWDQLPGKNGLSGPFVLVPWEMPAPTPAIQAPTSQPAANLRRNGQGRSTTPAPTVRRSQAPGEPELDDLPL